MKRKSFLARIWKAIAGLFHKLKDETKRLIPIAIGVVQVIKNIQDSPVDDVIAAIVKGAIPGDADDKLIEKTRATVAEWVPKVLLELSLIGAIANIEDQNKQLKAILAQFKFSSDESKNIFYHGLASLVLEKLADGKFTWSDATALSEYYYKNVLKPEQEAKKAA